MELIIELQEFDKTKGFQFNWHENFKIETKIKNNKEIIISANKEGLLSLANHLLNLAQDSVPLDYHLHFDEYNSLENSSKELIIQKIK